MDRKNLPCADCGQMMWRSKTSAPEGKARCRPCRRERPTEGTQRREAQRHLGRVQTWTCGQCGVECSRATVKGTPPKWCGDRCGRRNYESRRPSRSKGHDPIDKRSPIRKAVDDGDLAALRQALQPSVKVSESGCWAWQRSLLAGYPTMPYGERMVRVYRVVLEVKLGRSLGSEAAHHMCGNSACVNPEHLQPATARENTAEMLARRAYINRIAELEAALFGLAPNHHALTRPRAAA